MRITEQSHPLTRAIDRASPAEIVRLIGETEAQIFGSEWSPGLFDPVFLERVVHLRTEIRETLRTPGGKVVIAGAGTSGRLAVHAATLSSRPGVIGLLAGGLDAFFRAKEGIEDAPGRGAGRLREVLGTTERFVTIGISCGLSAAWVAGQVHETLGRPRGTAAVIGFNPLEDASVRPLPDLGTDFRSLLGTVEERGYLLNPIIGPEPIAGSTRMKGGSATRMILDILLGEEEAEAILEFYRTASRAVFENLDLGNAITEAGNALLAGRGIAYLSRERAGLMTMLDASECPPTFGARPEQVLPFVPATFGQLLPGFDLDGFTWEDARQRDLSGYLAARVGLALEADLPHLEGTKSVALVLPDKARRLLETRTGETRKRAGDLALKWMLNAFTTASFIRAGKVFGNRMIDVRISNLKLWARARNLVAELAGCSPGEADRALMRTLGRSGDPADLIGVAARSERVVPRAVLIARGCDPARAATLLEQSPRLRDCFD